METLAVHSDPARSHQPTNADSTPQTHINTTTQNTSQHEGLCVDPQGFLGDV